MQFEHVLHQDESVATIKISGLAQDLRILHITDIHVAESDERDPEAAPHADAYRAGCYQYVTAPGFTGGYRAIQLQAMR